MIRIGVDVGGTFTDVVVLDERTPDDSASASWLKVLTNDDRPAEGVLNGLRESGVPLAEVARVRLGTTLGVNAVLTRTGARTGLITTRGFRDVLEIRRTHRTRLFDLDERLPDPLIPRDLRLEVSERLDADGRVVTPLDEDGVRAAWRELRAAGVKAVAIVFLFSFENPVHELRAREIVLEEGGAEIVFASCDVLPVHREYERTSTTAIAAYVAPAMQRHLTELGESLQQRGLPAGRLSVVTSSGGVLAPEAVAQNPIPSLLSGPAAGVAGARRLAEAAGLDDVLTLDMGGTSCDVSGIVTGVPDERLDADIDGLAVSYPTFDIHTIGAGGGSIAWIDSGGALRVGPQSAGSRPGPACYGLGGERATVTDANLLLGRYDPEIALGGSIRLDPERARAAIEHHIAEPLGLSVERAAAGIITIVNALMAGAVRTISVERGRDVRDFTLVAFGGAGPVHGSDVARELGISRVLIPPCPGCTSALGAATADSRHDLLRTIARTVEEVSDDTLRAIVAGLRVQAEAALAREGFEPTDTAFELWLDLRYQGQAHELAVRCERANLPKIEEAVAAFHGLHLHRYGHSFSDVTVELINARLTGYGATVPPVLRWDRAGLGTGTGGPPPGSGETATNGAAQRLGGAARRRVYFDDAGDFLEAIVLSREKVMPDIPVTGPAVIHQVDATVLVPPGTVAVAHRSGSLILLADPLAAPPGAPDSAEVWRAEG